MTQNPSLFPAIYVQPCVTAETANPYEELLRQILVLRNLHLIQARKSGTSDAELQNQTIEARISVVQQTAASTVTINNVTTNIYKTVNQIVSPAPVAVAKTVAPPKPPAPRPAPPPAATVVKLGRVFLGGGRNKGAVHGQVEKFTFNGMSRVTMGWKLVQTRWRHAGAAGRVRGYWFAGQYRAADSLKSAAIEGVDLAKETYYSVGTSLSQTQSYCQANYDYLRAYICGSYSPLAGTIQKFIFSTEVASVLGTSLPNSTGGCNTIDKQSRGVIVGGWNNSRTFDQITFATDAVVALSAQLGIPRVRAATFEKDGRGYIAGGYRPNTAAYYDTVERYKFSNNSIVTNARRMFAAQADCEGVSGAIHGYSFGGTKIRNRVSHMRFVTESWHYSGCALSQGGRNPVGAGRKF